MPRALSNWLAVVGVTGAIAAGAITFLLVPSWLVSNGDFRRSPPSTATSERLKARNEVRTAGIALLAFLGVVVGSVLTWRTVRLTRDGQLLDRYAKAVAELASGDKTKQLSAIHTLDAVARNSPRHQEAILELLLGYIREAAGAWDVSAETDAVGPREVPAALRTATRAIATFPLRWTSSRFLGLAELDLRNVDFRDADLRYANLTNSNLSGAFLQRAHLQRARLSGVTAEGAQWEGARLTNADLADANLQAPPGGRNFQATKFRGANLKRTQFTTPVRGATGLPDRFTRADQ